MHEYGLMQDVVELALDVCRKAGRPGATAVRIEVGAFAVASRESLETAFEILTQDTPLRGARLEIKEVAGRAECTVCKFAGSSDDLGEDLAEPPIVALCPRCGSPLIVTAGAGITLVGVQLTDRGRPEEPVATGEGR